MSRGDLTDSEWRILNPLLPDRGERGPLISAKRRTINGILWVLRTGAPWRDMPERYGNWNVGLFDRPANADCVTALRAEPAINGFTDPIITLNDPERQRSIVRLREVRLLAPLSPTAPDALDAHPPVREWFAFAKIEAFAPLNGMLEKDNPPRPVVPTLDEIAELKNEAEKQVKIAADYIDKCGYHRRDEALSELQGVVRSDKKFADLRPRV